MVERIVIAIGTSRLTADLTMTTSFLDTLTWACTAFRTWAEFRESLEGGYYPTIYPRTVLNPLPRGRPGASPPPGA